MRLSKLHIVTLRDDPADAELPSHRLLARGGYIVKAASGLYTYGPLMWRTMKKITAIVNEEITAEGGIEVMMPIMHPRELWESSGRWDRYVADGILFTLKDSKGADFCLGPTHEEVITSYADQTITSYKQLPVNLYQIQDKFRDEIRPRYGLMRGREFIMMDAYSFDADQAGLDVYAKGYTTLENEFGERMATPKLLTDAVAAGRKGTKNGKGLTGDFDDETKAQLIAYRNKAYSRMGELLRELGPAPKGD